MQKMFEIQKLVGLLTIEQTQSFNFLDFKFFILHVTPYFCRPKK
jgi:hypothetical protein